MEKDDEIDGVTGSKLDFGARIYDSRVSVWLSPDLLSGAKPFSSPYAFAMGNPIKYIDADGNFEVDAATAENYKKLKPALKNLAKKIADMPQDSKFLVALKEYSGLTKEQITWALEDDCGPKLIDKDLVKYIGTYNKDGNLTDYKSSNGADGGPANAQTVKGVIYKKDGKDIAEGELQMSQAILDLLEDEDLSGDDMKSVVKLFESTVLHEIVHFGDHGRPRKGEEIKNSKTYEVGKAFEKDKRTYGKDFDISNTTNKVKIKAVNNDKETKSETK